MSRRLGKRTWNVVLCFVLLFVLLTTIETERAEAGSYTVKKGEPKSFDVTWSEHKYDLKLDGAYTSMRVNGCSSWISYSGSGQNWTITIKENTSESKRTGSITFQDTRSGYSSWIWTVNVSQGGKPHTHSWGAWSYTSGTCTSQGSRTRKCSCGEKQTESTGYNSSNHGSNSMRTQKKDATCTENGYSVSVCNGCGAEVGSRSTINKLGHNWGSWTTDKDSTCAETGTKSRVCQRCKEKQTDTIAKKEHTWGSWVTDKDSTCAAEGTKHRNCTKCSAKETGTIAKKAHTNTGKVMKKEATCTEDGYTVVVCSKCGAELESRIPIKAGHTWGAWKTEKEATCTATGTKSRTCAKCGKKESETLKALGHQVTGQVKTVAATCTKDGYKVIVCSRCGAEQGEREAIKAGHSWNAWVVQKEAGCETTGTKIRTCKNCSTKQTTIIPKLDHLVNGQIKTVAATCTKDGYKVVVCSRCGKEQEGRTVLKALGHNWGAWVPDKDATCHASGTKHRLCTRCNERQNGTITQLTHVVNGKIKRVEPTCTKEGYTVVVCSLCGDEMGERGTLKPTGHSWGGWITDKEAGCETAGTKHRSCNKCGAREGGTIPKLGHQVQGQVKRVESTCTKAGYTIVVCSRCGKEMGEKNSLPLKAHTWGKWETDVDAGCETEGTKHRNCTVCNAREDGTIPKLNHSSNGQIRTVAATCINDGYRVTVCSRCGKELGEKSVLPKTGIHVWGSWLVDEPATCEEAGRRHHFCVNCGSSEYNYPNALGHLVLGQIQTYTPDGGGEGWSVLVCSRCGKEMGYRRVFDVPETKVKIEFHIDDTHGEGITQPWVVEATYKKPIGNVFPKVASPKKYTITAWRDKDGNQYDKNTVLKSTQKLDLYPIWGNAGEYTIFFVGNGASSTEIKCRTVEYGKEFTLPKAKELFDDGIGFEKWGTAPDGGNQIFRDGEKRTNFAGSETSITLYALWNSSRTVYYYDSIRGKTVDSQKLTHVYKVARSNAYPSITLPGLKIVEWARQDLARTYPAGSQQFADGKDWVLKPIYEVAEEGKVAIIFYDSKRNYKDIEVRLYSPYSAINIPNVFPEYDTQHYLDGWEYRDAGETFDVNQKIDLFTLSQFGGYIILEPIWKRYPEELRLYYGYNNKVDVLTVDVDDYVLPKPEKRPGYTFIGWAEDPNDRKTVVGDTYNNPKYGGKLYAIWEPISFTIEFYDGITGNIIGAPVTVKGEEVLNGKYREIPGMLCYGWTDVKPKGMNPEDLSWTYERVQSPVYENGKTKVYEIPHEGKRVVQLYSCYLLKATEVGATTVIFDPNGGTGAPDPIPFRDGQKVKIPACEMKRAGCTFTGWKLLNYTGIKTFPYFSGDEVNVPVVFGNTSTVFLVAQWAPDQKIQLNPNHDKLAKIDLTDRYKAQDTVKTADLAKLVSNPGYKLIAFDVSQKYHTERVGLESFVYIPVGADITFTAIWDEERYKIVYHSGFNEYYELDLGTTLGKTKLSFDKDFLSNFHSDGYTFIGWTLENPNGDPCHVTSKIYTEKDNLEIDLTKNLDVYSCYKENPVTVSDGTTIKVIYDCLGGTDGPDPAEVTFKKTETFHLSDKIPKKEGYYFEGWKTYDILVDDGNYKKYIVDDVLRLYASWQPKVRNVMKNSFQSEYGREVMPDYMFLTEYESPEWKKIDSFCYFAIKTTQINSNQYFKEMDSIVLVVEYKDGKWQLTGHSSSYNWKKQLEYEILTKYTNDSSAGAGKLALEASTTLLSKHPVFKYLVKSMDFGSFWKEVSTATKNDLPNEAMVDKLASKMLDIMYKVFSKDLQDECLAGDMVLKMSPTVYSAVRDCMKDNKSIVTNGVDLLGNIISENVDNIDEIVAFLDDLNGTVKKEFLKKVTGSVRDFCKDIQDLKKWEHYDLYSSMMGYGFEAFELILGSITDSVDYQQYVREGMDPFGEMNIALKAFYDEIEGLGFDSTIKDTFQDTIEKIYRAYCYAK